MSAPATPQEVTIEFKRGDAPLVFRLMNPFFGDADRLFYTRMQTVHGAVQG